MVETKIKSYRSVAEAVALLALVVLGTAQLQADKAYFCEDRNLAIPNCDSLSQYYNLPNGKCNNAELGNKLCRSGWIPFSQIIEEETIVPTTNAIKVKANGGEFNCETQNGRVNSYTVCIKNDGKQGYLGELI